MTEGGWGGRSRSAGEAARQDAETIGEEYHRAELRQKEQPEKELEQGVGRVISVTPGVPQVTEMAARSPHTPERKEGLATSFLAFLYPRTFEFYKV